MGGAQVHPHLLPLAFAGGLRRAKPVRSWRRWGLVFLRRRAASRARWELRRWLLGRWATSSAGGALAALLAVMAAARWVTWAWSSSAVHARFGSGRAGSGLSGPEHTTCGPGSWPARRSAAWTTTMVCRWLRVGGLAGDGSDGRGWGLVVVLGCDRSTVAVQQRSGRVGAALAWRAPGREEAGAAAPDRQLQLRARESGPRGQASSRSSQREVLRLL